MAVASTDWPSLSLSSSSRMEDGHLLYPAAAAEEVLPAVEVLLLDGAARAEADRQEEEVEAHS